jgi:hypothetical protein
MQRSGLAVTAAVVLSMIPAAPQALAAPYVPNGAVFAAADGSIVEVGDRGKKYSKRHKKYRRGCNGCRSRYYARGYRYGYPYLYGYHRYRNLGGCVGYNGFWVCF